MKTKKRKKSCKGMTLVEILIALAIFAMLGAVMVTVGSVIDRTLTATTDLNRRVLTQASIAETRNTDAASGSSLLSAAPNQVQVHWVSSSGGTITEDLDLVEYAAVPDITAPENDPDSGEINGGLYLKFYAEPEQLVTVAPTTGTTTVTTTTT